MPSTSDTPARSVLSLAPVVPVVVLDDVAHAVPLAPALVAGGLPVSIFILRGFFLRQPKELEDAAILDGCSQFDIYWRVMLPLAKPGLAAVAVIQFLHAWNDYLLALVMFNSEALMPVQRGLTKFVSSDTPEQHILLAATAMSVLPIIVLYTVAQKSIIQGIMEGAVKG